MNLLLSGPPNEGKRRERVPTPPPAAFLPLEPAALNNPLPSPGQGTGASTAGPRPKLAEARCHLTLSNLLFLLFKNVLRSMIDSPSLSPAVKTTGHLRF